MKKNRKNSSCTRGNRICIAAFLLTCSLMLGGCGVKKEKAADSQEEQNWGYTTIKKEEFIEEYDRLTAAIFDSEILSGFCYTQFTDVEQETNGLLTDTHEYKFKPEEIKRINDQKKQRQMNRIEILKKTKLFVLDMDGTFYLGEHVLDGALDFISSVKKAGKDFIFFTNNSSKSQQAYIEKLGKLGIQIKKDQMMTSSHVIVKYLKEHYEGKSIYVLGTQSLIQEFQYFDMNLTEEDPDIVVLGFDTTLTYEKLSKACHYIRNGCTYFGINPDWNCPMEGGTFIPDCGSMAKLIEASTGRFPEFFGKPSKHTLDYIIQETGYEPDEIAIVGDRLYTDIAVADQSDVMSILVLSGESTREDVKTSDVKPNVILEDLSEITKML